jgi:hypothetical protein
MHYVVCSQDQLHWLLGIATAGVMSIFIFSFRRLKEGKRITPEKR